MARDDNATHTQRLSRAIDAAYEAYKAGEKGSEERLHHAFMAQAKNVFSFRMGSHDPTLQLETTHRAFIGLPILTGKSKVSTWFYRIAQNEVNRELRRLVEYRKMFVPLEADPEGEKASDNEPAAKPIDPTTELSVGTLRQGLPPAQAEVLALNAQGYSMKVIAEKLGVPLGTVASRYRLAKTKMKRKIQKTEPGQ